jgi:hypothetical protein
MRQVAALVIRIRHIVHGGQAMGQVRKQHKVVSIPLLRQTCSHTPINIPENNFKIGIGHYF